MLFEEMRSRDLAPNQLAYTMAIAACQMYPRTHWHTGLALLKDMLADPKVVGSSGGGGGGGGDGGGGGGGGDGTSLSPAAFSYAVNTCSRAGKYKEALQVLADMDELNVRMDSKTYSTAISLYQRAGNLTGAQMVFDRMIADPSVRPDIVAYRLLFNIYYENGAWREALAMLDRMAADKRVRIPPDIFKIAIRTCQKAVDKASPMSNDGVDAVEAAAEITRRLESRASGGGGGASGGGASGGGSGGGGNGGGKGVTGGGGGGGNSGNGGNGGKKKRSGSESGAARPSSQQPRPAKSGGGGGGGGKRGGKTRRPGRRGDGGGDARGGADEVN